MARKKAVPIDLVANLKGGFDRGGEQHPVEHLTSTKPGDFMQIPLGELTPNPDQPRTHFDPEALQELTESIRQSGVVQPIVAMENPKGAGFTIIAGERRWRAAKSAGLTKIPTFIRGSRDADEVALLENLQRQDLSPVEEADALRKLKEKKGYTEAALAKVIGKSQPSINQSLKIAALPADLKEQLLAGQLLGKTLILQALAQGGEEKLRAVLAGETPVTRAALRAEKKAKSGRPKNHVHNSKHEELGAQLTIRFTRAKATDEDVRAVLEAELEKLPAKALAARRTA